MDEIWKTIPETDGQYSVSNLGRVRSEDRFVKTEKGGRNYMGRLLKPGLSSTGYPTVMLGRKGGSRCLHDLVLAAFVGPRPEGFDACHKDGDKIHNTVTNLRWGTRADNMRDLTRHGGRKLTLNQAKWCRERAGLGETQTALAREFGVCVSQMNNIVHGRRYAR